MDIRWYHAVDIPHMTPAELAQYNAEREEFRAGLQRAMESVRHYVKTGRSIHDPQPPTLWQRIARWWARLKHADAP